MHSIAITAFYKFQNLASEGLSGLQEDLSSFGESNDMRGLVLLSKEGLNGTVCGTPDVIENWKKLVESHFGEVIFKDSEADELVYKRWFVKIRPEVVTIHKDDVKPEGDHNHLTPEEWNRAMEEEDVVVLDTRNDYETEVGVFENALDPNLKHFKEFPEFVSKTDIPKDKKVLMYCTGGIRCEKALLEMEKQGFTNVYQLKGGILAYIKEFPDQKFKGECFVFDHRVAVDQELKPSERYSLCPHCGDPGDLDIECSRCIEKSVICVRCDEVPEQRTCSKNCRYLLERKIACA